MSASLGDFAWAIRRSGAPLGAALHGPSEAAELLTVDEDGVLYVLASGTRRELVRFCLERAIQVEPSLGALSRSLHRGLACGLLSRDARHLGLPWA